MRELPYRFFVGRDFCFEAHCYEEFFEHMVNLKLCSSLIDARGDDVDHDLVNLWKSNYADYLWSRT